MARRMRRAATIVLVGALLTPVVIDRDGIPFSTYPMYAHTRPAEVDVVRAIGVSADGEELRLTIRQIADTRDPLVAQSYLNDAVRSDDAEALCAEVAERAGIEVTGVIIATERHDVVERTRKAASPIDRIVHATCVAP